VVRPPLPPGFLLLLDRGRRENPYLTTGNRWPNYAFPILNGFRVDPDGTVMNFTLYGIDIPLWLLFSLALIGLATCVVGGTVGAVSIIKRLMKPARQRLIRTPV
jgi:hypothetical protein